MKALEQVCFMAFFVPSEAIYVLYKVLFIHVIHLQNLPPHVQNLRTTDAPGSAVISVPDVPVFL